MVYLLSIMRDLLEKHNLLIAPMEGVMRPAVIKVCNALDLTQVWMTPFFRVSDRAPKLRELKEFMQVFEPQRKHVILQIMGCDAQKVAETACRGLEAGAAGIDLNCGCPSRQVNAHGAGAAMMRDFEKCAEVIAAVRNAIGKEFFSIKTRLGFYNIEESGKFLELWESAGAPDMFTLHYRTAKEGYLPVPGREERLQQAAKLIKNALVFGNGNVKTVAEADALCRCSALDGVMVGRGFWRDPYILLRKFAPERALAEAPDAAAAGRKLWSALAELPFEQDRWCRGSAIEMATLILGGDSPEARYYKYDLQK